MKITLSYQLQQLPPPFAYAAVFRFELSDGKIAVNLNIEYLGRETITLEEIRAEGFTENDDYTWSGLLNPAWENDILSFNKVETNPNPNEEFYLHIEVDGRPKGYPKNIERANTLFQELLQAVLEVDNLEAPLRVDLKLRGKQYEIEWNFSARTVFLGNKESKNWETGRTLMKNIYSVDYSQISPSKKPGDNSVMLDGSWYPLSNAIVDQIIPNIKELT